MCEQINSKLEIALSIFHAVIVRFRQGNEIFKRGSSICVESDWLRLCSSREPFIVHICERVLRRRITCAYCCGVCVCGGGHYHCLTPSCETGVCGGRGNVPSTLNIHSRCRSRVDSCCGACKLTTQNWVIPQGSRECWKRFKDFHTQRSRWKLENCFIIDWIRQSHARICECVSGTKEN